MKLFFFSFEYHTDIIMYIYNPNIHSYAYIYLTLDLFKLSHELKLCLLSITSPYTEIVFALVVAFNIL